MKWGLKKVEDQRESFCLEILGGIYNISEACRIYNVSRPTGYEWLKRFKEHGKKGLTNLSSARHTQSNKTTDDVVYEVLEMKYKSKKLGPKKIHAKLNHLYPEQKWPSRTTISKILEEHGLTERRRIRKRLAVQTRLESANGANDIWTMDFKGWSLTKENIKFDPFTLSDHFTRFLIKCLKLEFNTTEHVWAILDLAFREYGLPKILRSDNGPPFATTGPGRLSGLSVKLIKAGVMPEWIEPGKPQQNGRHERMHLTMEEEVFSEESLPIVTLIKRLEDFQMFYNFERPHEALNQQLPGSLYIPSNRIWDGKLRPIEYSNEYKIGRVSSGEMRWKGQTIYISRILDGENIGIKETENGYEVYFGPIYLGKIINGNELEVKRRKLRKRK